jgi:hypothetical protein
MSIGRRPIASIALGWTAMIGVDFGLHAGLLAPLYDWDSPFLLEPSQAFARIPVGYLGFLVLTVALLWLLERLSVRDGLDGARIAASVGAVVWGALLAGLWSISRADPALLAGWWIGQTVELGVGGFVMGSLLGGQRARVVAWRVAGLVVGIAVLAVLLQTVGYASPPQLAP